MIEGWYCKEKVDVSQSKGSKGQGDVFETLKLALSDFNDASPDYTVTRLKLSYLSYERTSSKILFVDEAVGNLDKA